MGQETARKWKTNCKVLRADMGRRELLVFASLGKSCADLPVACSTAGLCIGNYTQVNIFHIAHIMYNHSIDCIES